MIGIIDTIWTLGEDYKEGEFMFVVSSIHDGHFNVQLQVAGAYGGYTYSIEDYDTGEVIENLDYKELVKIKDLFGIQKVENKQEDTSVHYVFVIQKHLWRFLDITDGLRLVDKKEPCNPVIKIADKANLLYLKGIYIGVVTNVLPISILDLYVLITSSIELSRTDRIYIAYKNRTYELDWNKDIDIFVSKYIMFSGNNLKVRDIGLVKTSEYNYRMGWDN